MNLRVASSTKSEMPTFWTLREGRCACDMRTEASQAVSRGSKDGMYRKKNSEVREPQCGGDAESSTSGYKVYRKSIGLCWESEGPIVPFEDKGQHTL